jgi:hypothetical protein
LEKPSLIEAVTEDEIEPVAGLQKRDVRFVEGQEGEEAAAAAAAEIVDARRVVDPDSKELTREKQHWFGRKLSF